MILDYRLKIRNLHCGTDTLGKKFANNFKFISIGSHMDVNSDDDDPLKLWILYILMSLFTYTGISESEKVEMS